MPLRRAQGCLLGQIAGDSLGSLVEGRSPEDIREDHPRGLRLLAGGGPYGLLAGQPTDDSEMALALARTLVGREAYDPAAAFEAYASWLASGPFSCGRTIAAGLRGRPDPESQANGALMRISPLGVFGARHDLRQVALWAGQDAALTHPHPVCRQANALYAMAVAHAVWTGPTPAALYGDILAWAVELYVDAPLLEAVRGASEAPPTGFMRRQGWVLIALRNALWQLLHAPSLEGGVVDTVMRGGDTDTNAAICGALLGAVHGLDAIPAQWAGRVLDCRPQAGQPGVKRPRPQRFWPTDALELAGRLLG